MILIINADDFGHSERINNTIISLHNQGVVSSTTIIAGSCAFKHAIELSKNCPHLGIGVHLCLDGPFNLGTDYNTILDRETKQFFNTKVIYKKLMRFSVDKSEIFNEYCLQIEKVMDHKLNISHLDHHHHLHIFLPALDSMIKAAKKYKIPYIRSQKLFSQDHKSCFNQIYKNFHQFYLKARLNTVNGLFAPNFAENLNYEEQYKRLSKLLNIKNKTIEIMLHPVDYYSPETIFFSSERVVELLTRHTIINYHNL